jgi:hypothetical protein
LVNSYFTRIFKVLQAQGTTLGIITERANVLYKRREERHENPIQFRIKQQEKQEYLEARKLKKELDDMHEEKRQELLKKKKDKRESFSKPWTKFNNLVSIE